MTPSRAKLDGVRKAVRNLIERLNAPRPAPTEPSEAEEDGAFAVFFQPKLGGIRISGAEAVLYWDCVDTLTQLHGIQPDQRTMSREAVVRLLDSAILRTLRPRRGPSGRTREKFASRLTRELTRLRKGLVSPTKEWMVVAQVHGLGPRGMPFAFGGIDFEAASAEVGTRVAARIPAFEPKKRASKNKVSVEVETRSKARADLTAALSEDGTAVAWVPVRAVDDKAAKHLALQRLRRALDVLNFFAPFLQEPPGLVYRAYVAPEGPRTQLVWAAYPADGRGLKWGGRWPAGHPRVRGVDVGTERAVEIGLSRASALLASADRSDLEDRIVNALAWAGRARVEPRRDQAFLSYAIALEALLTRPSSRSGVTDRIRLRVAHLIGHTPETRKHVFDIMRGLYEIRSAIVHSGDSGALTDRDLESISVLVDRALTGVLTDERFTRMRSAKEFDQWFEDRVVG